MVKQIIYDESVAVRNLCLSRRPQTILFKYFFWCQSFIRGAYLQCFILNKSLLVMQKSLLIDSLLTPFVKSACLGYALDHSLVY